MGFAFVGLASVLVRVPRTRRLGRARIDCQQTKEAVKLAQGAMVELRKKTEGASTPGADLREYVVGVELLASSLPKSSPRQQIGGRRGADGGQPQSRRKRKTGKRTRQKKRTDRFLARVQS